MLRGSCLCEGVRFEVDGRLTPIQICHARRCQKSTGSAFSAEAAVRAEGFRWVCGEELISIYEAPILREPPPLRRAFCKVCGSPVPVVRDDHDWVTLLAGVLDEDPEARPFRHIFVGQGAPWLEPPADIPRFEGRPPAAERLDTRRKGS